MIGIIATPYAQICAMQREQKKMELDRLSVTEQGTISEYIINDRIMFTTAITSRTGDTVSAYLLLDTGSNLTVVAPRIAEAFDKQEGIRMKGAHTAGDSLSITGTMRFENTITVDGCTIYVMDLDAFDGTGIDGVIGMDVIQAGDLHVYRKDGFPYFEFTM